MEKMHKKIFQKVKKTPFNEIDGVLIGKNVNNIDSNSQK